MDLHFVWKSVLIVLGGILILRLAGRKSVSQLTVAQTVMMVAVGSLIIQPVSERNIWITLLITFLMVLTLIFVENLVLRFDKAETFIYGKSKLVIEDGKIMEKNLRKLRLTVDMLELRLRQQNVQSIADVKWATVESNGQLGFMLKTNKQYATKEDIQMLMEFIQGMNEHSTREQLTEKSNSKNNIFSEVKTGNHNQDPPTKLN
ncbi:DUF421 domain-containing protein [Aquibacillus kalidii]|uniref:DUF421 domain-containing protein n=1 Tax=Aquibacillus kalidii TaxID=2762597 RepID=UPI001645E802|nr:DUF421 domain-containing protein [Aquibacillus kalidii]